MAEINLAMQNSQKEEKGYALNPVHPHHWSPSPLRSSGTQLNRMRKNQSCQNQSTRSQAGYTAWSSYPLGFIFIKLKMLKAYFDKKFSTKLDNTAS